MSRKYTFYYTSPAWNPYSKLNFRRLTSPRLKPNGEGICAHVHKDATNTLTSRGKDIHVQGITFARYSNLRSFANLAWQAGRKRSLVLLY